MHSAGYKSKTDRLELAVADLKNTDQRERAKAARELAKAKSRLEEIDAATPPAERLLKEAEAARRKERAAKYDRRAAAIGRQLTEIGERLRRAQAAERPRRHSPWRPGAPVSPSQEHRFHVFLSFAGEQRDYVKGVADCLMARGYRVFYDAYQRTRMWGGHMTEHFDLALREESRRCVPFISRQYREKDWTRWEWRIALSRALEEEGFLLPARFDDTQMPGLPDSVYFMDLRQLTPGEFAAELEAKLGPVS